MEMEGHRSWKLGIQEVEDMEIEEVVLRIQGIMCHGELPPIQKPFKVWQSIMLTGLSSPKFNDAILSIHAIEDTFRQHIVDGNMEVWDPSSFQGHASIYVGNQYFTPFQHALQDRQISFNPSIDPDNILSEAMGEEFVHTEDNEVKYYEAHKDEKGTK